MNAPEFGGHSESLPPEVKQREVKQRSQRLANWNFKFEISNLKL